MWPVGIPPQEHLLHCSTSATTLALFPLFDDQIDVISVPRQQCATGPHHRACPASPCRYRRISASVPSSIENAPSDAALVGSRWITIEMPPPQAARCSPPDRAPMAPAQKTLSQRHGRLRGSDMSGYCDTIRQICHDIQTIAQKNVNIITTI